LTVLERRLRASATAGDEEKQALKARQASLDNLRRDEADARQRVEQAERELALARQRAETATQRLAAEGGERYQARHQLQSRREQALAAHRQARANLIDALGGLGPL